MNAVGIDVSKGKRTVTVMRPFGEVVFSPFKVSHTDKDMSTLAEKLKSLPGETRVVMEHTGYYHAPVALALHESGVYASAVNAMLVHDYGNNSLRRAKIDKKRTNLSSILCKPEKVFKFDQSCHLTNRT